jgi:ABC-type polysaccharide/polyol phosphate export permease
MQKALFFNRTPIASKLRQHAECATDRLNECDCMSERLVHIKAETVPQQALADMVDGARYYKLWSRLAFHDIRQRFRRSMLGPFWLTLSMGILIGAMGLVFSTIFRQDVARTLPYIATGVIFWGLLTTSLSESTSVFILAESYIRNVPLPISVHFYQMLARNVIIWGFNMIIYFAILIIFQILPGWSALLIVPGFILFLVNTAWISLAAGILSTRYRDIPQVIANLIQVFFFITPVFWSPEVLVGRPAFVTLNPLYHLLEIVRSPLLGNSPYLFSWCFCFAFAVVGIAGTGWLYRRAHARIAYWV